MKRLLTICAVVVLVVMNSTPAIGVITMDFEGMSDGQALGTYYLGVTFEAASSGQDWVAGDSTTNGYNTSSWPSGQQWLAGNYWHYGDVFAWTGVAGDNGKISFDNADASYVQMGYTAYRSGGGTAIWLEAYDSGGNLLDSDSGVSNLRYADGNAGGPGTLSVSSASNNIAYVLIHDTGNFWEVDNISTDASGVSIIPAPGAILLGSIGVALVGWMRRRRTL